MAKSNASGNNGGFDTSASLLLRLRHQPDDQAAWSRFVDRYGPQILSWCRAWRLQDADARELTQIVLVKLLVKLRKFDYEPSRSFRGWLRKLTRRAWAESMKKKWPIVPGGDSRILSVIEGQEAREDLVKRIEREFDLELWEEAERRVRKRVESQTWEAYRLVAVEGLPGIEVAERLDMRCRQCLHGQAQRVKDAQGGGQEPGGPAGNDLIRHGFRERHSDRMKRAVHPLVPGRQGRATRLLQVRSDSKAWLTSSSNFFTNLADQFHDAAGVDINRIGRELPVAGDCGGGLIVQDSPHEARPGLVG